MSTTVLPQDGDKKTRTKAKERYLKRKKDRRKQRQSEAAQSKRAVAKSVAPDEASQPSSQDETEMPVPVTVGQKERPRKKRKVSEEVEMQEQVDQGERGESDNEAPETEDVATRQERSPRQRTPTTPTAFPIFPLPVAPDAPSKSTLALQGLDKALLAAEVVNPSYNVSIDELGAERSLDKGELPVLDQKMKKRLRELGINDFFAVQTALLPFLLPAQRRLRALYLPYDPPRDVCASAPTGSGKTLAYVVPIVEILSSRIATRLRALIVLPTRDLVQQVQETIEAVGKGRGLKIGVATGQHSFAHEQAQLVPEQTRLLQGGASNIDILICTPGRLIDHLNGTPNFTLQHLRFLVIDEADRLLAQSFQDWLAQVLAALRPQSSKIDEQLLSMMLDAARPMASLYHDGVAPHCLPSAPSDFSDPKESSCQKLLFSATLTRDPAKIAALGLRDPKYFVVQESGAIDEEQPMLTLASEEFAMPAELKEHYISTTTAHKPLVLFYLVHMLEVSNALVFTKSAASTKRLVKLFEFFEEAYQPIVEVDAEGTASSQSHGRVITQAYSSDLPPGERKAILEKFKKQEIGILVCSDLVARGLDIPHVAHVVSYDAPIDLRKYVHRAGRTARAGRSGDAWTLVEEQEAHFFKQMLRSAGKARLERVARVRVKEADLAPLESAYEAALGKLKDFYSRSA